MSCHTILPPVGRASGPPARTGPPAAGAPPLDPGVRRPEPPALLSGQSLRRPGPPALDPGNSGTPATAGPASHTDEHRSGTNPSRSLGTSGVQPPPETSRNNEK